VLLLVALAWVGLFHFSVVRGSSMTPSIQDGDRIVVDHLSYVMGEVRRGDVVVLRYPLDPTLDYIKRVIGLPGERVRLAGGRVWIDGEELVEPYVAAADPATRLETTVAPGHYFVLGDNRPHSSDSREFGLVPRELLVGRVDLRVWPLERLGPVR
jgi:signal peptidase I